MGDPSSAMRRRSDAGTISSGPPDASIRWTITIARLREGGRPRTVYWRFTSAVLAANAVSVSGDEVTLNGPVVVSEKLLTSATDRKHSPPAAWPENAERPAASVVPPISGRSPVAVTRAA